MDAEHRSQVYHSGMIHAAPVHTHACHAYICIRRAASHRTERDKPGRVRFTYELRSVRPDPHSGGHRAHASYLINYCPPLPSFASPGIEHLLPLINLYPYLHTIHACHVSLRIPIVPPSGWLTDAERRGETGRRAHGPALRRVAHLRLRVRAGRRTARGSIAQRAKPPGLARPPRSPRRHSQLRARRVQASVAGRAWRVRGRVACPGGLGERVRGCGSKRAAARATWLGWLGSFVRDAAASCGLRGRTPAGGVFSLRWACSGGQVVVFGGCKRRHP